MPDARLTPEQLARFRADYRECGVTVMPLLDEIDALTAERDLALSAARGEQKVTDAAVERCKGLEAERDAAERTVELAARHGGKVMAERDCLALAVRDALARLEPAGETCLCRDGSQLDVATVRAGLRHALDTLAPEGGG